MRLMRGACVLAALAVVVPGVAAGGAAAVKAASMRAAVQRTDGAYAALAAPSDPTATGTAAAAAAPRHLLSPAPVSLQGDERTMLRLINRTRAAHGLASLRPQAQLSAAAHWKAGDLTTAPAVEHVDSLGDGPGARAVRFGFSRATWRGEMLVAGAGDPVVAFSLLLASPPHRAQMLGAHYRYVGIAHITVPGTPYVDYWAVALGSPAVSPAVAAAVARGALS